MEKFPEISSAEKSLDRPVGISTKRIGDDIVFFCVCGRYLAKRIDWLIGHPKFFCPDCGAQWSSHNILMVTDGVSPALDAIRDMMKRTADGLLESKE
jgi:hypothetical protein